jgi:hypothetical protein
MCGRCVSLVVAAALLWGVLAAGPGDAQQPGSVPAVQIKVTGDLVPVETLRWAVVTVLRTALPEALDADISLVSTTPPLAPLPVGGEIAFRAEVRVAAAGAPPADYAVPVAIANVVLPLSDPQVLLVSNSPESPPFGKVLYTATLGEAQTVRLLYHHQNGSPAQRMSFLVTLSNPTVHPVMVWVTGAGSEANSDELTLGHEVTRRFLDQYWRHAGFLLQIPPNITLPLFLHTVAPGATVSGLAQLAVLEGERLTLRVSARLAGETDPPGASFAPDFDTFHQRGAFARPWIVQTVLYTVGDPALTLTIGGDADLLHEEQSGQLLQGNYGVLYTFHVKMRNPTPDPVPVEFTMYAPGGQARGTFLVDDQVVHSPVVLPGAPERLATVRLGALDERTLILSTMPESGANYPVRVVIASVEGP